MYQEYPPHPVLSPYIDKYWEVKGSPEMGEKMKILPDGCTDFIFNLDDARNLEDKNRFGVDPLHGYFVGAMKTYSELSVCAGSLTHDRGQIYSLRVDYFHEKAFRGAEWAETSFEGRGISFS